MPPAEEPQSVDPSTESAETDTSHQNVAETPIDWPQQPYRGWQLAFLATTIIVLVVTFLGIWPVHELLFPPQVKMPSVPGRAPRVVWQADARTAIRVGLTEGIMCLWVFAFGASMGSFLHVVLYRVPLGKSIVGGGSKCPHCGHAIRATDNLPVLGWLRLGGKCRDCGWPIPFRYPLAELLFGGVYLGLALLQLHWGAPNVPGYSSWPTRLADNIWPRDPLPLLLFVFHLALVHWLLLGLLFAADGNRLPRGLFWFAVAVGVLLPLGWPGLHPVDWQGQIFQPQAKRDLFVAATTSLAGFLVGGLVAWRWLAGAADSVAGQAVGGALWLTSVYCGWQLGLVAAVMAAAIDGLLLLGAYRQRDITRLAFVTALIGILFLCWRGLMELPGFPQVPLSLSAGAFLAISLVPRLKTETGEALTCPPVRG